MSKSRILVISDTHWKPYLIEEVLKIEAPIDQVIHLGDMDGHEEKILNMVKCPFHAVRGNCDMRSNFPNETMIAVGDHLIFLTHGHYYDVRYDLYALEDMARECGADVAMYGHTHIPYFEQKKDGFVICNPGSLGNPRGVERKASYLVMELDKETDKLDYYPKTLE